MKNRFMITPRFSVEWPQRGYDIGVWYEPGNLVGRRLNEGALVPEDTLSDEEWKSDLHFFKGFLAYV